MKSLIVISDWFVRASYFVWMLRVASRIGRDMAERWGGAVRMSVDAKVLK
jgi:hypothetical protein